MEPPKIESILVADDDRIVTVILRKVLEAEGMVDVVFNGLDAFQLIEKKYYKLIVSDISMPIMDGISLFLLATNRFPSIRSRFLFVSGGMSPSNQLFCSKNNLLYIDKPFEVQKLIDIAHRFIHSS